MTEKTETALEKRIGQTQKTLVTALAELRSAGAVPLRLEGQVHTAIATADTLARDCAGLAKKIPEARAAEEAAKAKGPATPAEPKPTPEPAEETEGESYPKL